MKGKFWRKALAAALALLVVSGSVPIQPLSQVFENIAITASAETYLTISTIDEWNTFASSVKNGTDYSGKTVVLDADLDFSGVNFDATNMVGDSSHQFKGIFDGQGHTIKNISLSSNQAYSSNIDQSGLFVYNHGTIKNIVVENCEIWGKRYGALIAAQNCGGIIEDCTVSGTVGAMNTNGCAGGIAANNYNGTVRNCYVKVTVRSNAGSGIIVSKPTSSIGTVENSYYTSDSRTQGTGGSDKGRADSGIGLPMFAEFTTGTNVSSVTPTSSPTKTFGNTKYYAAGAEATFNISFTDNTKKYTVTFNETEAIPHNGTYTVTLPNATAITVSATEVDDAYFDLANGTIEDIYTTYSRELTEIKPEPVVKNKAGLTLTKDTDYTVEWSGGDFLSNGTYTVTVTGKGIYSGTKTVTYQIISYEVMGGQNIYFDFDTDGKYYKITSAADLNALSSYVNGGGATSGKRFKQTDNITLTNGFYPIGTGSSNKFQGIYDGGKKVIRGLSISENISNTALFGYMIGGTVKNVILINPNVSSSYNDSYGSDVSALVGYMGSDSAIENCHVVNPTLSATGGETNKVGVFCANWGSYCSISNCYFYDSNTEHNYALSGRSVLVYSTFTNAERVYAVNATNCTFSATATIRVNGTDYYKKGSEISLSHEDRTGYHFDSYTVNDTAIDGDTYTMVTSDANIAATFSANTYTIVFDKNTADATGEMADQSFTYDTAQSLTENSFERTGYDFAGWNTQADGKGTPYTDGQSVQNLTAEDGETITLYAQWTPYLYSVVFNGNSDTVTGIMGDQSFTYDVEQALNPNSYARTGYTFAGWNTEADGSGDSYANEAEVKNLTATKNDSFTLYAQWTANKYTVAFDANGGSGEMDDQNFTYDTAQSLTENSFERTGYTFKGWNTKADGSGTAYADKAEVSNLTAENNGEVTLYAQWEVNNYTVHFDVNNDNAYGEMTDQNFTYDEKQTLTVNAFGSTTGEFIKWNTEPDGSGTDYADGAEVQNLTAENGGTVTLYAQWHKMYLFDYDDSIFSCYVVGKENEKYWAYPGDTVQLNIIDDTYEYTIAVKGNDGTDIAFDTSTNTFVMPDQPVKITSTSVKKIDYTSILLDSFEAWDDVSYVYDENDPTVTPIVTVKDGETTLTEGTDYTLSITNNTGKSDEVVTAIVTITGKGNYVGTNTKEFRITPFDIANCELKGKLEAYDDGYGVYYPLVNNVQVWDGDTQLESDTDYNLDIEYADSYEVGQTYTATIKGTGTWGGTMTFTFTVVELSHNVVFDSNGGTGTMASDVATKGQYYDLPECTFTAPYGYEFDYWEVSCEEGVEKQPGNYFTAPYIWNESDVQTITVTAHWKEKAKYSITLPDKMEIVSGVVTDGKAYADEVITFKAKEGYTANNVMANDTALTADEYGVYTVNVDGDVTVSAEFEKQKFTVTWKNGDTILEADENVEYGTTPTYNGEAPTKTADAQYTYTFSGWSDGTNTYAPDALPTVSGNVTYTAQFNSTAKTYTITYKVDGEVYDTKSVSYGNSIALPDAPTREGYTFSGWQTSYTTMPAQNIEISGTFTLNQYAVTYMVDGVQYGESLTVDHGTKLTAPEAPTKNGAIFLGWTADGVNVYDFETPVTAETTLTAMWLDASGFITFSEGYAVTDDTYNGTDRDYVGFRFDVNMDNSNYTVVQHGILYGMNIEAFGNGKADANLRFTDDSASALMDKVREFAAQNTDTETTDWIEIYIGDRPEGVVYARGFIIVTDGTNKYLIYSDVQEGSYNSFSE